MAAVFEIPVGSDWVNVNTASGLVAGTQMELTNKGSNDLLLTESLTEPTEDDVGKLMTTVGRGYAIAAVLSGSDTIWARCLSSRGTVITAQEIV